VESEERLANYLRRDELHTSFNFEYLKAGWDAERMREVVDRTIATHEAIGAPPTWVLSNHDVVRHRTRLAPGYEEGTPDEVRGLARARAATAFALALPGSAYLYQGEELGLPEVDLPDDVRQDPAWHRSGGTDGFRDGCRVPIPWTATAPNHGFGPTDRSWLPQPAHWAGLAVAVQEADPDSTLHRYRELLRQRRAQPALQSTSMSWLPELQGVEQALGIRRVGADGSVVDAVVNLGQQPLELPPSLGTTVIAASGTRSPSSMPTRVPDWSSGPRPAPGCRAAAVSAAGRGRAGRTPARRPDRGGY
jgi:alpha-glucosidase